MATTNSPETAPPRSAMRKPSLRLDRTAAAVRILARIDTHIPIYPAVTEQRAPRINDSVVQKASWTGGTGSAGLGVRTYAYRTKINTTSNAAKVMMVRFCHKRNASAPSFIALEI